MPPPRRAPRWLALLGLLCLGGCGYAPPLSTSDRDTLNGCRREADRVYDAQNRYQLSERDSRDSPFSSSGSSATPNAGLADQYEHAIAVDDCVRRGGASGPAPDAAPNPTGAPAGSPAPR